ncbi:MAG: hypothetical protein ABIR18_06000, partial [Chitinophagaceae bacterium]
MNTSLPNFPFNRFTSLAVIVIFQFAFAVTVNGQCAGNLLVNGSFESPSVPVTNGNNIMGPGNSWGGWDCTNGGLNILRVQGSGYASGANVAHDGDQYVDVANSDGYIYQQFTLTYVTPIFFNGSFSNREPGWSSYINWIGKVEILDSTGTVIATSTTRSFITTDDKEMWYTLSGSTSNLVPGKYTYRAYAGNSGHFDNAAVCALANTVLSVKLQNFTTAIKGRQVNINWTVSEEENLNGYELQFSADGIHFKTLSFLKANNSSRYSSDHKSPVNGSNYYRLKMNDLDGKTSYSAISKINFTINDGTTLYPNPANGFCYITLNTDMINKSGSLMILTLSGRVIQQQNFRALNETE